MCVWVGGGSCDMWVSVGRGSCDVGLRTRILKRAYYYWFCNKIMMIISTNNTCTVYIVLGTHHLPKRLKFGE